MQTQINWIKYEGKTDDLKQGEYFVYGACIKGGEIIKEMRRANFLINREFNGAKLVEVSRGWNNLDSFIIEYIAPLSEIERGIEEAITPKPEVVWGEPFREKGVNKQK